MKGTELQPGQPCIVWNNSGIKHFGYFKEIKWGMMFFNEFEKLDGPRLHYLNYKALKGEDRIRTFVLDEKESHDMEYGEENNGEFIECLVRLNRLIKELKGGRLMGSCRKSIRRPIVRRPIVTPKDRGLFCTEEGRQLLHALSCLYGGVYDESKDKIEKELLDKIDNLRGK